MQSNGGWTSKACAREIGVTGLDDNVCGFRCARDYTGNEAEDYMPVRADWIAENYCRPNLGRAEVVKRKWHKDDLTLCHGRVFHRLRYRYFPLDRSEN